MQKTFNIDKNIIIIQETLNTKEPIRQEALKIYRLETQNRIGGLNTNTK